MDFFCKLNRIMFSLQGLYYSYFKNIVEAPSFLSGVESLYNNNLTEYPDSINTLQRFNLYPEVNLSGIFNQTKNVRKFNELSWSNKCPPIFI